MTDVSFQGNMPKTELRTEDTLGAPRFELVSAEITARVIGYIAVEHDTEVFCRADIIKALDTNPTTVSKLTKGLLAEGFIESLGSTPDPHRSNRPTENLRITEKLLQHVAEVPKWNESAAFFQIKKHLGLSEAETQSYLIRLGKSSLIDKVTTDNS
jgi:DNA-binding MarR family transcriptional regulator